jgi:alpha-methylacyl-CoA racemase
VRIVEIAGLGPAPFAAMILADLGADVIRVDRPNFINPGNPLTASADLLARGRRSLAIDLKHPAGLATLLQILDLADVVIEGFRPGVTERLGFGPDVCLERNPGLIYGRMTGWGQHGPWSARAGHDINYIALSGALEPIGSATTGPQVPLNLVGDFGGGSMFLVAGILAALWERTRSGRGQVIDAAIVDGASTLMTMFHAMRAIGAWSSERGTNLLDGGAHFYRVYRCADGRYLSVGAIEPQFYTALLDGLGLETDQEMLAAREDRARWPEAARRLEAIFATRARDEWAALFDGSDACVAPVLRMDEAAGHRHNIARHSFTELAGACSPRAAPRFSRSRNAEPSPPPEPGEHTIELLAEYGLGDQEIQALLDTGAVHQPASSPTLPGHTTRPKA